MEPMLGPSPAERVLDAVPDAVFALDARGCVVYANSHAETALGRLYEEMAGRELLEELPELAGSEFAERVAAAAASRAPAAFEVVFPPRDAWVYARIFPWGDGVVVTLEDVPDRRRLEQERARMDAEIETARRRAEQLSGMKDEFLSMLSHELRTPLGAVVGWVHLLRSGRLDDEGQRNALDVIERNARAQAQLVKDLLDISRIARGRVQLRARPMDLRLVVQSALEAAGTAASAKGVRIEADFGPGPVHVLGDPERLHQLVWNVLSNAVKFTPEGGRVSVRIEGDGASAQLVVADTGIGMTAEFLPRAFDRFTLADQSLARQHRGLGIGLAIARGLAEMHGGSIHAESGGLGRGSTFTITLPPYPAGAPAEDANEGTAAHPPSLTARLEGLRVLVVDDDPDACETAAMALSPHGAEVRACGSSRVAIEAIESWRPHVLLVDTAMPDESGYELIRSVRSLPPERGGLVPAAVVTAGAGPRDRTRALAAGFQILVPKPIDVDELVAAVASLTARTMGAGA